MKHSAMMYFLTLALAMTACTGMPVHRSTASVGPMTDVARKDQSNSQFCPTAKLGEVCQMKWTDAIAYCLSQKSHLPTARELAELLPARGSKTLEKKDVTGPAPAGYYLVEGVNPGGKQDAFYLNHSGYKRLPEDDQHDYLIWTATTPPGYDDYAHVYYNSFGGGGGEKEDHNKSHPNAVMCVKET